MHHLRYVHVVRVKYIRDAVPSGLFRCKPADGRDAKIPNRSALFADNFAGARVSPLHEIQMQFGAASFGKVQVDPCRVFDVDFETAEMFRPAGDFGGTAQKPADVIQFVGSVENDAAAQLMTRAVAFLVVLPWAPIGKILSCLDV